MKLLKEQAERESTVTEETECCVVAAWKEATRGKCQWMEVFVKAKA